MDNDHDTNTDNFDNEGPTNDPSAVTPEDDKAAAKAAAQALKEQRAAERAAKKAAADAEKVAKAAKREQEKAERLAAIEAEKAEREQARAAAKKAQEDAKAAKKAARENRIVQNGVRRPLPDTKCGAAWALFEEIGTRLQRVPTLQEVVAEGVPRGLVEGNLRVELSFWRKFHGIKVVRTKAPAPAAEAAPAAA